jgi:hypothetical protein
MHKGFWWENQKERAHNENPEVNGRMVLRWIVERWDGVVWTGLI